MDFCHQPIVQHSDFIANMGPWQIPAYYGRDMAPANYTKPTNCDLSHIIDNENQLCVETAQTLRNSEGGTEVTLGLEYNTPTPLNFVHSYITQPSDVRLEQVFERR